MTTININSLNPMLSFVIGRRGENEVTEVVFDYSAWINEYGQGVISLLVKRSQDDSAYPVTMTLNNGKATWLVTSTDTQYVGGGRAELVYTVNGKIAKSVVYKTSVLADIGEPSETPPDPYETWLDTLVELGAEVEGYAQAAEASAEDAEEYASHYPKIEDDYWYVWDAETEQYVNTEIEAKGSDGSLIWHTSDDPIHSSYLLIYTEDMLTGVDGATPKAGDLIYQTNGRFWYLTLNYDGDCWVRSLGSVKGADGVGVPAGGTTGQVLAKASGTDYDTEWVDQSGGGGTSDYSDLTNKPQINSHTLSGNQSASDLGLGTYSKPSGGIPLTDLASDVQTSLGKADTALQSAPVTSVNSKTGAVTLAASDVGAIPVPVGASAGQELVYSGSAWAAQDKVFVVNCTPTALDYSGTMDATVGEIYAAWQSGQNIVFRVWAAQDAYMDSAMTFVGKDASDYPSFNAYVVYDANNVLIELWTGSTSNASKTSYGTYIYYLNASTPVTSVNNQTGAVTLSIPSTAGDVGAIPAPASPSAGDVLTYSSGAWAAAAPVHELPAGGNSGAVLAKNGSTDYSVYWRTISDYTAAGIIITSAATAAKVCQYSFWDDTHYPQVLYVTLASANTAASALTLKVNGKGPYPVYINGAASSATNYTLPAGIYFVLWDGTNFYFQTNGKIPAAATDPQEVTISTAGAVSQALDAGKIYHFTGALTSLAITLNAAGTGEILQYHFDFDSGSTAPTVTLPGTVTMQGGTFTPEASKHYEIDILNGYGVYVEW